MEKITRKNIEAWVLDYQEGNLSERQIKKLMTFLESNPDLDIDINFSDFTLLNAPDIEFPGKADLFRTDLIVPDVSEEEIECIARLEGDMIPAEAIAFDQSLKTNPEKAKLFQELKQTFLKPDTKIVFQDKSILRKKRKIIPMNVYRIVSAAAVIVLAWVIFFPRETEVETPVMAEETRSEIIYIDKLANPARFDKIAMTDPVKKQADCGIIPIDNRAHDVVELAYLDKLPIKKVIPTTTIRDKDYAFIYRSLPYPEDIEYQTLLAVASDVMREKILGQDSEFVKNTKFSFWELADVSLDKVAGFLALPIDLEREYDEDGRVESIAFDSRLVAFTTPVNNRRRR